MRRTCPIEIHIRVGCQMERYIDADRRDADLMSWAQTIRRPRAGGYRMTGPLDDRVYADQSNVWLCGGDIRRYISSCA